LQAELLDHLLPPGGRSEGAAFGNAGKPTPKPDIY
jgi:hypothetical protein